MNDLVKKIDHLKIILFFAAIGIATIMYSLLQKKDTITNTNNQNTKITIIDLTQEGEINYLLFIGLFLLIFSFLLLLIKYYSNNNINLKSKIILTPKEKESLLLIEKGLSNKDISKELFISVSTVKTHINNIFKKKKVTSREALILK